MELKGFSKSKVTHYFLLHYILLPAQSNTDVPNPGSRAKGKQGKACKIEDLNPLPLGSGRKGEGNQSRPPAPAGRFTGPGIALAASGTADSSVRDAAGVDR